MASNSLVSVLIPLYNKAEWVESTIQSVLDQTHTNLEVLVIDDGSTDGSADVVSRLDDDRIVLIQRENRGANVTRNELLELANGTYIQHLDADDVLLPQKIELQLAGLEAGADVSLCPVWIDIAGGEIRPESSNLGSAETVIRHGIPTFAPLHRLTDLKDVGGWTEGLLASQEYDLHLRLLMGGFWQRPHQIDEPLGIVRVVERSTSGQDHRVYRAKAKVLRSAATLASPRFERLIAHALVNAGRHLAQDGDFPAARDALATAFELSGSSTAEIPRRLRWISNVALLARVEWIDSRLRQLLSRQRIGSRSCSTWW